MHKVTESIALNVKDEIQEGELLNIVKGNLL